MELTAMLAKALLDIVRVDATAGSNDAAYRKQMRIILNSPGRQHVLSKARDAPAEQEPAAPKPRKRTQKPKEA